MLETNLKGVERPSFSNKKSDEKENASNGWMFTFSSSKHD